MKTQADLNNAMFGVIKELSSSHLNHSEKSANNDLKHTILFSILFRELFRSDPESRQRVKSSIQGLEQMIKDSGAPTTPAQDAMEFIDSL